MKKGIIASCIMAALYPAVSVAADEGVSPFLGVKAGYQTARNIHFHNDDEGYVAGVFGGLQLSDNWSWDLGYQHHDELNVDSASVDIKTWLLETAMRYDWRWSDSFGMYGRLGLARWDMTKDVAGAERSENGWIPLTEVGLAYRMTPSWQLSMGYQYLHDIGKGKDMTNIGEYDSHAVMLSLAYLFGQDKPAPMPAPVVEIEPAPKPIPEPVPEPLPAPDFEKTYPFDTDSAATSESFQGAMSEVAELLKAYPDAYVIVVGHTDSVGQSAYNQKLSERRANSVAEMLQELGVDSQKIHTDGRGDSEPVGDNATAEGRSQNRRVELTIPYFENTASK